MRFSTPTALLVAILISVLCELVSAQTLRLNIQGNNANRVTLRVGEVVTVEVFGDLRGTEAAGFSLYITVPDDAFQVVDQRPSTADGGQVGVQPFIQGPVFQGAGEQANSLIPETDLAASSFAGQQLEYAAVIGGAGNRIRTGSGVLATFQLVCIQPIDNGLIQIDDNPIRETRLVLSDGISEARFITVQGLEISVTGLEIRDIPDVVLMPGQADSTTIGRLSDYVAGTRPSVNIDSIQWSFEPTDLDSIQIEVDPETQIVRIIPVEGWSGRQRIIWTATEPESASRAGQPPISATEISNIVVNNPPSFLIDRDSDGVRRDSVSFFEDAHPFIPLINPNPSRAFDYGDLDLMVQDPDVVDPQLELRFAALSIGGIDNERKLMASVVRETHHLLIWSLEDFAGRDSLRLLVSDGLRGGTDTLLIVVDVEQVADAPIFILDADHRNPKISRGGTKTYLLPEIVTDVDTPLDSLAFSWTDDPGENFTVDTTRTSDGLEISIKGRSDFAGDGRVTFNVMSPEGLDDTMVIFVTSAEALPPSLIQDEIKVEISPGADPRIEHIDSFVEDPDNSHDELSWTVLPGYQSEIDIDQERMLSVAAPPKFIGYEEVVLTVSDPDDQGDDLKLRIYASDGDPVAGGLPDLVLDRNESHQQIDLDDYYYDSDNEDFEIFWERLNTFDQKNLEVNVDPITHGVVFFAPETAIYSIEMVVFRVTSPEGASATDTMLVTIQSDGGGPSGGGEPSDAEFRLEPFPDDIQVAVGSFTDVFNVNDFVQSSGDVDPGDLDWQVEVASAGCIDPEGGAECGGEKSIPSIRDDGTVSIFGYEAGIDTLLFTAEDLLGQVQTQSAVVRVVGENEFLRLRSIPDIQFIAQQNFTDLVLSDYIEDPETHPYSVVSWSYVPIDDQGSLIVRIDANNSVFVTAADTIEALGIFVARNNESGVVGRDTVRIIAIEPEFANRPLKKFPMLIFAAGEIDSTIALNDFLPENFIIGETGPEVSWAVSGQKITRPLIDPKVPHRLRVTSVGQRVGVDSLIFTADIGGGFHASGTMVVNVIEPVDESTLDLQVVPNPLVSTFIDVFVVSRRELSGTPNVIRSFASIDSTVAVRQSEDDLDSRGVLIWTGGVQMEFGVSGLVRFEAQAFTALGTDVRDTASVEIAAVAAGKRVVLAHEGVHLDMPPEALGAGTTVLLQVEKRVEEVSSELELRRIVDVYPAGQHLTRPGRLAWEGMSQVGEGLYRFHRGTWTYLGNIDESVPVEALGRYGILRDHLPPRLELETLPGSEYAALEGKVIDGGSGLGSAGIRLWVNDEEAPLSFDGVTFRWPVPSELIGTEYRLKLVARDRAGNERIERIEVRGFALPQRAQLETNYPNPFNPETTIPLLVPAGSGWVKLTIYNAMGQLVRTLVNRPIGPGRHRIHWDGRAQTGERMGSGIYLYRMETTTTAQTRSMTLVK